MMPNRKRTPLKEGNRYVYPNFPNRGFRVKWFTFKDNDGLKGVAVHWFGMERRILSSGFYPYESERAFWQSLIFKSMIDQLNSDN